MRAKEGAFVGSVEPSSYHIAVFIWIPWFKIRLRIHSFWIVITLRFVVKVERALKLQFISDFLYVAKAFVVLVKNSHIIYPSAQNPPQLRKFQAFVFLYSNTLETLSLTKWQHFLRTLSVSFGCRLFFICLLLLLVQFALEYIHTHFIHDYKTSPRFHSLTMKIERPRQITQYKRAKPTCVVGFHYVHAHSFRNAEVESHTERARESERNKKK